MYTEKFRHQQKEIYGTHSFDCHHCVCIIPFLAMRRSTISGPFLQLTGKDRRCRWLRSTCRPKGEERAEPPAPRLLICIVTSILHISPTIAELQSSHPTTLLFSHGLHLNISLGRVGNTLLVVIHTFTNSIVATCYASLCIS